MDDIVDISQNQQISRIAEGCLHAIIAESGFLLQKTNLDDDYGVDYELKQLNNSEGRLRAIQSYFYIQLKCTTNWKLDNENIIYDLEAKTFNDIVDANKDHTTKLILFIMCMDKNRGKWCDVNSERLVFSKSLFWYRTDEKTKTENKNTVRIKIPIKQTVTRDALISLVDELKVKPV